MMRRITFLIDAPAIAALDELCEEMAEAGYRNVTRSAAVRMAIRFAAFTEAVIPAHIIRASIAGGPSYLDRSDNDNDNDN